MIKILDAQPGHKVFIRVVDLRKAQRPSQMLARVNRNLKSEQAVVKTIPESRSEVVVMYFINTGSRLRPEAVDSVLKNYGLKPNVPAQIQANVDDDFLADHYPNVVQWEVVGKEILNYVAFASSGGSRCCVVSNTAIEKPDDWPAEFWISGCLSA